MRGVHSENWQKHDGELEDSLERMALASIQELDMRIDNLIAQRRQLLHHQVNQRLQNHRPSGRQSMLCKFFAEGEIVLFYYINPINDSIRASELQSVLVAMQSLSVIAIPVVVQAPGVSTFLPQGLELYDIPFFVDSDLSIGTWLGNLTLSLHRSSETPSVSETVVEGFAVAVCIDEELKLLAIDRETHSRCASSFGNIYSLVESAFEQLVRMKNMNQTSP
ncbi:MAG: hypothetical protein KDD67_03155 [Ignavibacteriae bacterium]|nr:hypothetical protein [Ignavibacteriota bacterium]MCB9217171.1 hypothetical protein [Ignavibacteria bacterium]